MVNIVKAIECAREAVRAVNAKPRIMYNQEDCQAFIENTVQRAGGKMKDYRGSNDMFRNACSYLDTLDNAVASGHLRPGAVLFILEHNGREPERYKVDGKGNASHIGWYTGGIGGYEAVHSSASRGGVYPSTLKNGWTHVGWLKEVDYSDYEGAFNMNEEKFSVEAKVYAKQGSTVNLRQQANKNAAVVERVPIGTNVDIIGETMGWKMIRLASGKQGWMMEEFLLSELSPNPIESDDAREVLKNVIEQLQHLYTKLFNE